MGVDLQAYLVKRKDGIGNPLEVTVTVKPGKSRALDTYTIGCKASQLTAIRAAMATNDQPGRFEYVVQPHTGMKAAVKEVWYQVKKKFKRKGK